MHPRLIAQKTPHHPAITIAETGASLTYGELEALANKCAHTFRSLGLKNGDTIAVWMVNSLNYLPLYWAAQRAGLRFCPIATHLSLDEAEYIIRDCGAKLLIVNNSVKLAVALIERFKKHNVLTRQIFYVDDAVKGARNWEALCLCMPETAMQDEQAGFHLVYSSGTTGRPKGIKVKFPQSDVTAVPPIAENIANRYQIGPRTKYLSPAPLYHTAPLVYSATVLRCGGHLIVMKKFTPEAWLGAVETFRVTVTQMVPTMFIRLLRLPAETRKAYHTRSLKYVIHAAAPCPVDVKQEMIDWLGPIIYEYYAGSEGIGSTAITSQEWLRKKGSVGRAAFGTLHICTATGQELADNQEGLIYFEGGQDFEYLNDEEKTDSARNPLHQTWYTLGDIGYVDEEGYLFLTDRKSNMIISGGVNIYPRETENLLIQHPKVQDVAVVGIPHPDMGEQVVAYVELMDESDQTDDLEKNLIMFCRNQISHVKCPKSIRFIQNMPRTESGKLIKRRLDF